MQEIHTMGGGKSFAGGGSDADRRMRPQHHLNHQALRCPRCDSLHTKFCYYNNYNLSQPRHFCKSCRRYWTKGGVLRNVPVGGGCRKSSRSKPKNSVTVTDYTTCASPSTTETNTPALPVAAARQELVSNSHSSNESSSLTAANAASATTAEAISTINESKFFVNTRSGIPILEAGLLEHAAESGIFSEIGSFTSLMTSTSEALPFEIGNMTDASPFRFIQHGSDHLLQTAGQHNPELKLPEITGGSMLDQMVQVDLSDLQNKTANADGGFGSLDWQFVGDHCPFDLSNNPVDQTYWYPQSNWPEHDRSSQYLP